MIAFCAECRQPWMAHTHKLASTTLCTFLLSRWLNSRESEARVVLEEDGIVVASLIHVQRTLLTDGQVQKQENGYKYRRGFHTD